MKKTADMKRKTSLERSFDTVSFRDLRMRTTSKKIKLSLTQFSKIQVYIRNEIPNFRKDSAAKEELDKLVAEIAPTCSYDPAGFDKESIRQHILDVINERRRRHRSKWP